MQIPNEAVLLRIYIGESDRWQHQPLYGDDMIGGGLVTLEKVKVIYGRPPSS